MGVEDGSIKRAGIFGHPGRGVVAVGDHQIVEGFDGTVAERDVPCGVGLQAGVGDCRVEADVGHDAEEAGIALKVSQQLFVRGVIGIIGGHRVVVVLRELFGTDEVGGFKDAGMAGVRGVNPCAADGLTLLIDHEVMDADLKQVLGGGDAGRPGSDNADARVSIPKHDATSSPDIRCEYYSGSVL